MAGLDAGLVDVVGRDHVLVDPELLSSYVTDWTGRYVGHSTAVVRPANTAEVQGVVQLCRAQGVSLVLQGGNTGLVGGSVPLGGEVVLSLRRLTQIEPVDAAAGQVTAGAGVTIGQLQQAAGAAGWAYGVDLASRDSATVGGTIATNAGGLRVLRYGDTRAQLMGIEAVLGDGSVISHLGGLWKDNTGYDLAGLLCGSEGTLGVVTAARLRLVPPSTNRAVALLGFDDAGLACQAAATLRRWVDLLEAVELFLDPGLQLVCSEFGLDQPFGAPHAAYLLVEATAATDPTDRLGDAVASLEGVTDAAVASAAGRRAALWRYREAHTEAIARVGIAHKMDVAVPLGRLAELVERVPGVVAAIVPEAVTWLFGHAADGNLHVNVTGVDPTDERVDGAVLELVAELGGSISAEHGIGVAKRPWLRLNRSAAEVATMAAIRAAMDPDRILNPAGLF